MGKVSAPENASQPSSLCMNASFMSTLHSPLDTCDNKNEYRDSVKTITDRNISKLDSMDSISSLVTENRNGSQNNDDLRADTNNGSESKTSHPSLKSIRDNNNDCQNAEIKNIPINIYLSEKEATNNPICIDGTNGNQTKNMDI